MKLYLFSKSRSFISLLCISFAHCVGPGEDSHLDRPSFASSGAGPVGADLAASSTNFSRKVDAPSEKATGLEGASFISPPEVTNYGALSMSYPIEAAPGRAGVEPRLSLSYSSSGGDGLTGIGWSFSAGLASASVSRTTRYGALSYNQDDTFTYNGKRLVKTAGPPGSENGTYREEIISSFVRLELSEIETGGVWHAYDSSGRRITLGERLSHPRSPNLTYSWKFSKVVDLNGNSMEAVYDRSDFTDKRMLHLKEVRYTGNTRANEAPRQFVRLHYTQRSDSYISQAAGFLMRLDKLLSQIEIGWGNAEGDELILWDYELVYITSEDSQRPLLKKVTSSRRSTSPEFHYQEAEHLLGWRQIRNIWHDQSELGLESTRYFEGDFNGDGISDMCFFSSTTGDWRVVESRNDQGRRFKLYGNRYQGYTGAGKIQFFKGNVTGDYNGDGRSDIAFYLPETRDFIVAESRGDRFEFQSYGRFYIQDFDLFQAEWFTGDFDANGISDIVLFDEPTGDWFYMRNRGPLRTSGGVSSGGFEFLRFARYFKNLYRSDYSHEAPGQNSHATLDPEGHDKGRIHWLQGDYNADGRTDISFYDERNHHWWAMNIHPAGCIGNIRCVTPPPSGTRKSGSGLQAEVFALAVFETPPGVLFSNDRFSGDFNGDGFSDFLLFDRDGGRWLLGEVTAGSSSANIHARPSVSVNFRIYGRTPRFKKITRWLQGDFNGDGRTDIGFYSETDHKFWIGEASPSGFRYRIYNDLNYGGPDKEDVMKTPLPKDEVSLEKRTEYVAVTDDTKAVIQLDFSFDANPERGETTFAGCFSEDCKKNAGLLIYNKKDKKFLFKTIKDPPSGTSVAPRAGDPKDASLSIDLNGEGAKLLEMRPIRYGPASDFQVGLIYYEDSANHSFKIIKKANPSDPTNHAFGTQTLLSFGNDKIKDFSLEKTELLLDHFRGITHPKALFLVSVNQVSPASEQPKKYQVEAYRSTNRSLVGPLTIEGPSPGTACLKAMKEESEAKPVFKGRCHLFSGNFDGRGLRILMADTTTSPHTWYQGSLSGTTLTFAKLTNNTIESDLPSEAKTLTLSQKSAKVLKGLPMGTEHIFFKKPSKEGTPSSPLSPEFIRISLVGEGDNQKVEVKRHKAPSGGYRFTGVITRADQLLFTKTSSEGKVTHAIGSLSAGSSGIVMTPLAEAKVSSQEIKRPDLLGQVYPFRWIQGDYNGDSKTDVGIFHVSEPHWYFAMTRGTVPDLMRRVDNGIHGFYEVEYENSSRFDNTGEDDVPDLSVNYKVVTSLSLNDGLGREVKTSYAYRDGYAFSDFIDGKKETDHFGFSYFRKILPDGQTEETRYHTTPYPDYRLNRALAGAMKEKRFLGFDGVEYTREAYSYDPGRVGEQSYYVTPASAVTYSRGHPRKTARTQVSFSGYELAKTINQETDHYQGPGSSEETVTKVTEYHTTSTNQRRPVKEVSFQGSREELTKRYTYDDRGNLSREVTSYTGSGLPAASPVTMSYIYDTYGNVTKETNSSDTPHRVSLYEYDSTLHQFRTKDMMQLDGYQLTRELSYHTEGAAFSLLSSVKEPSGSTRYFEYDRYARLTHIRGEGESERVLLKSVRYLVREGRPLGAQTTMHTGGDDPEHKTAVFADGMGRELYHVRTALTGDKGYVRSGRIVYDGLGRVVRKSQTRWADEDEFEGYIHDTEEKHPTLTEYDASGRVKRVTLPQAEGETETTRVSYVYNDPWEVVTTHSIGQGSKKVTNARGHLLEVTDFGHSLEAKVAFCYDLRGNRIKKMDTNTTQRNCRIGQDAFRTKDVSGHHIAYWQYDGLGRLRTSNDPDFGVSSYGYNGFGDMVSKTDALNRKTTYGYDQIGRRIQKVLPGDEGTVTYTFDRAPADMSLTLTHGMGRLVRLEDHAQRKEFTYDKLGRIKAESRRLRTKNTIIPSWETAYITEFGYDLLDRIKEIGYPRQEGGSGGMRVTYSYNGFGRVNAIGGDHSVVNSIDYNEFGQMGRVSYANGLDMEYVYDIKGRVKELVYYKENIRQVRSSYVYDTKNNIRSVSTQPEGEAFMNYASNYSYGYDGLSRLVDAQATAFAYNDGAFESKEFKRGYSYALNGNLTEKSFYNRSTGSLQDRWSYTYHNHSVTGVLSSAQGSNRLSMGYDAVGNMTTKRDTQAGDSYSQAMVYDSYNRIRRVSRDTNLVGEYDYDDQGFRVRKRSKKQVSGLENGQVVTADRWYELEYHNKYFAVERQKNMNGDSIPDTEYSINNVYLDGVRVAALEPSGAARYFLTDQVDSVKITADSSGKVVSRTEYHPYGETWFTEGVEDIAPKYNGQELDQESDFYYFNARHYDPELARFVTADIIVDGEDTTAGWNRYMYVHGNPIKYKDPTGHCATPTLFTLCVVGVGVAVYKLVKSFQNTDESVKKSAEAGKEVGETADKLSEVKDDPDAVADNALMQAEKMQSAVDTLMEETKEIACETGTLCGGNGSIPSSQKELMMEAGKTLIDETTKSAIENDTSSNENHINNKKTKF